MTETGIKLRRSAVPGKIPTTAQLELGEFAVNTHDGKLYTKKSVDSVESIVTFSSFSANESLVILDTFTGDGTTTAFVLSRTPLNEQDVLITINGVSQHVSEYSLSGNTITFLEAPALNDEIEARTLVTIPADIAARDYQTYIYTASSNTVFGGADLYGNTLTYDVGKIEVYTNGVRLVNIQDFTATNGSTITTLQPVTGTVEIVSLSRATFLTDNQLVSGTAAFVTSTADQVADTFDAGAFRTAKYVVQITSGGNYHSTEALLVHDGTNVFMTEYATIFTNTSLGTINGDIFEGQVRLLVSPTLANSTVKIQRISVGV